MRIRGRLAPSLAVIPHREPEADDAALIAAARQGDGAAFTRLFRRHSDAVRTRITRLVGIKVSKQVIAKSAARWLPLVGSIGVAGYAYYDTAQVAATATQLFDTPSA